MDAAYLEVTVLRVLMFLTNRKKLTSKQFSNTFKLQVTVINKAKVLHSPMNHGFLH